MFKYIFSMTGVVLQVGTIKPLREPNKIYVNMLKS